MNAPALSGTEMMLKRLLQFIGIKPEQILEPLSQIRGIAVDADTRMTRIEAKLDLLLKQQEISHVSDRNIGIAE